MKIGFIARSTLFKQPGGDTQQVIETASALETIGVDVDIILSSSSARIDSYDLLHFFNLGRPADLLRIPNWQSKPLFISTIWVDYGDGSKAEWWKAIARGFIGNDRIPPISYLVDGHAKSMEKVIEQADLFITTTKREIHALHSAYPNATPNFVVPPGIPGEYLEFLPNQKEERSGILCIGRFEPLKNQLSLIEATRDMDVPVTFVGDPAANNSAYYRKCKTAASSNHYFRPHSSMNALRMLYRSHKVLVAPSHFETFGLTTIEGLSQGCTVIAGTNVGATEYFTDEIATFDSSNVEELKSVLIKALEEESNPDLIQKARSFTWDQAASKLKELYATRLSVND